MKISPFLAMIILFLTGASLYSQSQEKVVINPADPAFRQKYENVDFNGKFSVQVLTDNTNNYFIADFSKFRDKYEKVYFLFLVFQNGKVVNLDGDLNHNKIWFLSDIRISKDEINNLLQELKTQTEKNSSTLTVEQKATWLLSNDKYK